MNKALGSGSPLNRTKAKQSYTTSAVKFGDLTEKSGVTRLKIRSIGKLVGIGEDFSLNVETCTFGQLTAIVKYPQFATSLGHQKAGAHVKI